MPVPKLIPWHPDRSDERLFRASPEEVREAIWERKLLDHDRGGRFRTDTVRMRRWAVGFVAGTRLADDGVMRRYLEQVRKAGSESLLGISAPGVPLFATDEPDVQEHFDPPLVAKLAPSEDDYALLSKSAVTRMSYSFYLFPPDGSSAALVRRSGYAMYAGPEVLVSTVLGTPVVDSWAVLAQPGLFNKQLLWRLKCAMKAFSAARPVTT